MLRQFLKHVFKLQFLLIILAVLAGIYYPQIVIKLQAIFVGESIDVHFESAQQVQEKIFTKDELSGFNGENEQPIYLAMLGRVYDVTKGVKHYGQGCAYSFFVGRDASKSFVTGEFEDYVEEEADDVISLKSTDLLSLDNWQKFYEKDYTYKGKVVGRFYDSQGQPTKYYHKYHALLEVARAAKVVQHELRLKYPDCNIEWSAETGSHVWCTQNSGGKERDWLGFPRKLFEVGSDNFRCACLKEDDLETTEVMIKAYDNCETLSHECYYNVN